MRATLPDSFDVPFVSHERVLGAPVTYSGRQLAPIAQQRVDATVATLRRIRIVPLSFSAKAELCSVAATSKMFALECRRPTLDSINYVRREVAAA